MTSKLISTLNDYQDWMKDRDNSDENEISIWDVDGDATFGAAAAHIERLDAEIRTLRNVGVTQAKRIEQLEAAHLIAAAPDLLEACEAMLSVRDSPEPLVAQIIAVARSRAAIRKARGET